MSWLHFTVQVTRTASKIEISALLLKCERYSVAALQIGQKSHRRKFILSLLLSSAAGIRDEATPPGVCVGRLAWCLHLLLLCAGFRMPL
jgi:hypothetical protein